MYLLSIDGQLWKGTLFSYNTWLFSSLIFLVGITGWAVAQTCCISQCAKYRKSGIFGYPWEQNPSTDRHETWGK